MTESAGSIASQLRDIYLGTLARCEPGAMLREAVDRGRVSIPVGADSIVALGKCAAPLAKAAAILTGIEVGLVIHPEGYGQEVTLPRGFERLAGSHPVPSERSMIAARRAIAFVGERERPILFLVSGGASACMEDGLVPNVTLEELAHVNQLLLAAGLPIDAINTVRRHLSGVKGGRLGALAPPGSVTLVYSDVPPGRPELVGSGPTANDPTTLADAAAILRTLGDAQASRLAELLAGGAVPETLKAAPTGLEVIADSDALVKAAMTECRERGVRVSPGPGLDGDVADVAGALAQAVASLADGHVLVSAGESTVSVRGSGRGGRCSELGARFVLECDRIGEHCSGALFGSSDGRDGASPAAAVIVRPSETGRLDRDWAAEALGRSASYELVAEFGEPIIMMPTGNNLRDFAVVFRGR